MNIRGYFGTIINAGVVVLNFSIIPLLYANGNNYIPNLVLGICWIPITILVYFSNRRSIETQKEIERLIQQSRTKEH